MEREKGVESRPCAECGEERLATQQGDGSVSYAPCPNCSPTDVREEAKLNSPPPPPPLPPRFTGGGDLTDDPTDTED